MVGAVWGRGDKALEEGDSYEIWGRGGGGGKNNRMGWETFSHCTRFVNGMENWVQFWHDCWCGDHPLKAVFPTLYETAIDRELGCEVPS